MLRGTLTTAAVLVLVLGLVVALLWVFQRRLVYLPDSRALPAVSQVLGPAAREVTMPTEDGLALKGWLLPASPPGAAHVLVFPGNAGNRADRARLARQLAATGVGVLLVDYRGFGGNPGRPSEEGLVRDGLAARSYLVEREAVPPERLVYLGESLGAGVATALALRHPPAGLVLRSPFSSLADVGRRQYPMLPVGQLLWDRFPVLEQVAAVRAPTVVVYGTADEIVPAEQSRAVAAAAPGLVGAVAVDGARHNDPDLTDGPRLIDAVRSVLDR